jgi:potassium/chloride transporter 9
VLTALPAPEPGTSLDHVSALRYIQQLESLFADGPPMLGVHAKQLTVSSTHAAAHLPPC